MARNIGETQPKTHNHRSSPRTVRKVVAGALAAVALPTLVACQTTSSSPQLSGKALQAFEAACIKYGGVPSNVGGQGTYACYFRAGAYQENNGNFSATGVSAVFTQDNPKVGAPPVGSGLPPSHENVEIWAESAKGSPGAGQVIEFGELKQSGDSKPRIFVNYWINGRVQNLADYGQNSALVNVGIGTHASDPVQAGKTGKYAIQFSSKDNAWDIDYNNQVIAKLPESIWTSHGVSFKTIGYVGVWGEVAISPGSSQPTQMGDGTLPDHRRSAYVTDYQLVNSTTPANLGTPFANTSNTASDEYGLDIGYGGVQTYFYYGGPGISATEPRMPG